MRLKINGREVEAPAGAMVKDAALAAGIRIPGLCDHPSLEPYGGCRLCLVEIDGIRGYPSSCTMPISEGMVIRTDTPAIKKLRQSILEMLLSEHPWICLTCERAGKCDEIREAMRKVPQSTGCRYCPQDQRCELQEVAEMIGLERVKMPRLGSIKEVVRSPFFDRDPNLCILCGRCIRACQDRGLGVISFTFRGFEAGIGTAFDKPLEESGCRFCGACVDVCPTGALMERGAKWAGAPENTVITTCPYCSSNCQVGLEAGKGGLLRARPEGSRLCVRGRFGLEFVGHRSRLRRPLVRKSGKLVETTWDEALDLAARRLSGFTGEEFALFTSGTLPNEALFLARKFAREVMMSEAVAPDVATLGGEDTDLRGPVIVVGDLAQTNPSTELHLRSQRPVVVSPFNTLLASRASHWLQPGAGQEPLLLASLSAAFEGEAIAVGDILADEISFAAAKLPGASVVVGPDCSQDVRWAASDLASAAGGRLILLGRSCNSRGAEALGLNLKYEKAMSALSSGALKAAYMAGLNPVRTFPAMTEAISRLEFLVVQDLFLTETARLAQVVLPAASFAEIDGTFLGAGGKLLSLRQAIQPMGRPDWQIFAGLGRSMGGNGFDLPDPRAVLEEMLALDRAEQIALRPRALAWISSQNPEVSCQQMQARKPSEGSHLLVEGPGLFQFGSGTRTSKVFDLQYLTREPRVEIGRQDAKEMGIEQGDPVVVDYEGKSIRAKAEISRKVPPGILHISALKSGVHEARVRKDV